MNARLVIKWCIYVMAIITVCLAIAMITVDSMDNSAAQKQNPKGTSKTGANVCLFLILLITVIPIAVHYFHRSKLLYVLLFLIFTLVFIILRCFLPLFIHFGFLIVPIINWCVSLYFVISGHRAFEKHDLNCFEKMMKTESDIKNEDDKQAKNKESKASSTSTAAAPSESKANTKSKASTSAASGSKNKTLTEGASKGGTTSKAIGSKDKKKKNAESSTVKSH